MKKRRLWWLPIRLLAQASSLPSCIHGAWLTGPGMSRSEVAGGRLPLNDEMQRTKHGENGASPLISVLDLIEAFEKGAGMVRSDSGRRACPARGMAGE